MASYKEIINDLIIIISIWLTVGVGVIIIKSLKREQICYAYS